MQAHVEAVEARTFAGIPFVSGTLSGKPVVIAMCGLSMVNAAMTAQILIDRFAPACLVVSGIAGGIDPELHVGDVVVPQVWSPSFDVAMGRLFSAHARSGAPRGRRNVAGARSGADLIGGDASETGAQVQFQRPAFFADCEDIVPFNGMFPVGVRVGREGEAAAFRTRFEVDAGLMAVARALAETLSLTTDARLEHRPRLVCGGTGVSGSVFVDQAAYRDYLFRAFAARVADMETAAVAQVAYAHDVPFLAFRSVSDLAGAEADENRMMAFWGLASANAARVVEAFVAAM